MFYLISSFFLATFFNQKYALSSQIVGIELVYTDLVEDDLNENFKKFSGHYASLYLVEPVFRVLVEINEKFYASINECLKLIHICVTLF
jgi:hypothetical protein